MSKITAFIPSTANSAIPSLTMTTRSLLALFLATIAVVGEAATNAPSIGQNNWPQWRGPMATGVAPDGNAPTDWSETKNIKWKVKIPGQGHATPIIWGRKVFIQTAIATGKKSEPQAAESTPDNNQNNGRPQRGRSQRPNEAYQFTLLCLDRSTGKVIWQQVAREEVPHEGHHPTGSFAAPSPVTDGNRVYAYFGSHGLYCYDMEGKLYWSQDFGDMRISNGFGEGSSPAIHGNVVVLNWDNEGDDFIVAVNKNTGEILWKKPREERTSWSTPLIVEHEGKAQVITTATGKIRSYDLNSGDLIWECGGLTRNVIPTPVAADGVVYVMSGFQGNALLAIKLGRTGDLTGTDSILWKHSKSTPYVPSPLLDAGKLFFFASNNGILSCFDARTGAPNFDAERFDAINGVYASPVSANGKVYLVGRNGATVVIKSSEKLEVLATNTLDEQFDASPAIVGKELFLRGHEHLYCIAED